MGSNSNCVASLYHESTALWCMMSHCVHLPRGVACMPCKCQAVVLRLENFVHPWQWVIVSRVGSVRAMIKIQPVCKKSSHSCMCADKSQASFKIFFPTGLLQTVGNGLRGDFHLTVALQQSNTKETELPTALVTGYLQFLCRPLVLEKVFGTVGKRERQDSYCLQKPVSSIPISQHNHGACMF